MTLKETKQAELLLKRFQENITQKKLLVFYFVAPGYCLHHQRTRKWKSMKSEQNWLCLLFCTEDRGTSPVLSENITVSFKRKGGSGTKILSCPFGALAVSQIISKTNCLHLWIFVFSHTHEHGSPRWILTLIPALKILLRNICPQKVIFATRIHQDLAIIPLQWQRSLDIFSFPFIKFYLTTKINFFENFQKLWWMLNLLHPTELQ